MNQLNLRFIKMCIKSMKAILLYKQDQHINTCKHSNQMINSERVIDDPTDEEDSGEDEDLPTRTTIKRQAQQLVDAKTKRKQGKRKKGKK